jgi:hypothetical protein
MNSRIETVSKSVEEVKQLQQGGGPGGGGGDARRMSILQRRQSTFIRQQSIRKKSFSAQTDAPSISEMGVGCDLIGEEEAMHSVPASMEGDEQTPLESEMGMEMDMEMGDDDDIFQLVENMQKEIQTLRYEENMQKEIQSIHFSLNDQLHAHTSGMRSSSKSMWMDEWMNVNMRK